MERIVKRIKKQYGIHRTELNEMLHIATDNYCKLKEEDIAKGIYVDNIIIAILGRDNLTMGVMHDWVVAEDGGVDYYATTELDPKDYLIVSCFDLITYLSH